MKSQPGHAYLEMLKTLKGMLNDSESKAETSLNVLNDLVNVEKALQEKKVIYSLCLRHLESFLISHYILKCFFNYLKNICLYSSKLVKNFLQFEGSYYNIALQLKDSYSNYFQE